MLSVWVIGSLGVAAAQLARGSCLEVEGLWQFFFGAGVQSYCRHMCNLDNKTFGRASSQRSGFFFSNSNGANFG